MQEAFPASRQGGNIEEILALDEDVQVLHGFATVAGAAAYLKSGFFNQDIVLTPAPCLDAEPEIRIYEVM